MKSDINKKQIMMAFEKDLMYDKIHLEKGADLFVLCNAQLGCCIEKRLWGKKSRRKGIIRKLLMYSKE